MTSEFTLHSTRAVSYTHLENVVSLYVTEAFLEGAGKNENIAQWLRRFNPETVSGPVMSAMADTQTPQGILAVVRQKIYTLDDIPVSYTHLTLVSRHGKFQHHTKRIPAFCRNIHGKMLLSDYSYQVTKIMR